MGITVGDTRLVGTEPGFGEGNRAKAMQLLVAEVCDWDAKSIDLCEGKFALIERVSNPATLVNSQSMS